jgi:lipopolysaccharide transport system ATP-binding protein
MSGDWTVRVDCLWRKFSASARDTLRYGMIDTGRRLIGGTKDSGHLRRGEFWALQDVSFELRQGEALGIMGVNGSGKTTLLRILNGTYSPDRGSVSLRGRVGSLIAAGAGFSPLLSGRENIHINGLLLGLTPGEIRQRFDEIVAFAGLEAFIDMPVRNYSSGMTVRLGFSIAVASAPDILLVDEVLAVGDIAFQKRCYERIHAIRDQGTSIILVSHSVGAIWSVCDCGLFLNKGISSGRISAEELGRLYELENARSLIGDTARNADVATVLDGPDVRDALQEIPREYGGVIGGSGDALVDKLETFDLHTGVPKQEFDFGEDIGLRMEVYVITRISQAIFRYSFDAAHYRFICNADSSYAQGMGLVDLEPGRYWVSTRIRSPRFRAGAYTVNLAICQKTVGTHLFFRARAGMFVVKPRKDKFVYDSDSLAVVDFDADFQCEKISGAPPAKAVVHAPVI